MQSHNKHLGEEYSVEVLAQIHPCQACLSYPKHKNQYTVWWRFNAAQYHMISHKTLQKVKHNINHGLYSQNTPISNPDGLRIRNVSNVHVQVVNLFLHGPCIIDIIVTKHKALRFDQAINRNTYFLRHKRCSTCFVLIFASGPSSLNSKMLPNRRPWIGSISSLRLPKQEIYPYKTMICNNSFTLNSKMV